jgi:DNA-binding transcriptional regulator YiaG
MDEFAEIGITVNASEVEGTTISAKGMTPYKIVKRRIQQRAVSEVMSYQKMHTLSYEALGRMLGCTGETVRNWECGKYLPDAKYIQIMFDKGIVTVLLPKQRTKRAMNKVLMKIDKGNEVVKRAYNKKVAMPDVVRKRIISILDEYANELTTTSTFLEFVKRRDEFASNLYETCK